jgi:NAD(P) transhydrogenase
VLSELGSLDCSSLPRVADHGEIVGARFRAASSYAPRIGYASMVTALNIKVTVIEARPTILDFVDREMIDSLMFFMRQRGAAFRLGEKVLSVGYDGKNRVVVSLESGKEVHGDALLYTVGRKTNADLLNLEAVRLSADDRGRIAVNEFFQTAVPHI